METMNAVVYRKKRSPEKLVFTSVEKPLAGDNDVLVKLVATAINAADYRSMKMGMIPKKRIFGADVSGTVEAVGEHVKGLKPGDEVIGDLSDHGFGGFAEYAIAPEKAWVIKPSKLSFEDAAALPMAGMTALQALRNKGKIQKGHKVLIAGSGGGVGTFAIQLAANFGAEVTAVCGTKNVEQSKLLGATKVIDYTLTDFTRSDQRFDLILGINGNKGIAAYHRMLSHNGIYVMVGGDLPQIFSGLMFAWLFSMGARKMTSLMAKTRQEDMEFLAQLAGEGKITPVIHKVFPLEKTAEAIQMIRQGHSSGKVIITMKA